MSAGLCRPSIGRADGKDNVLCTLVAARAQPLGKGLRAHRTAAAIEQNRYYRCPGLLAIERLEESLLVREGLRTTTGKWRAALEIGLDGILEIPMSPGAGADMDQADLHAVENNRAG